MQFRKLGRTNLLVSSIGFGALPLTGLDEEGASRVLNAALDAKVNFIDTARGYRESEELIGKSISPRRSEFILATKTKAWDEKGIREELAQSLHFLKTDRIDLYQIHYVNSSDELSRILRREGALRTLQRIKQEGIVDFIGITGHKAGVLLQAARTNEFDTVQGAFSYIEKERSIIDVINYCAHSNIGFIAQKPLAGGAITCAPTGLKWILNYPVSTVIPGMISVQQVIENAEVGESDLSLSEREIEELDALIGRLDKHFCRRCYYCQPVCPEGIRIGVILEFYGKAKLPENLSLARRLYRGLKVNGKDCTGCSLCVSVCPYELPIVDMLRDAHGLLK